MPSASPMGDALEGQLRQACADLDERLRRGEPCRAERFFSLFPLLATREDYAIELIYTEFVTREELGRRPPAEEYFARFPYWKPQLLRQFQVHELLRDSIDGPQAPPAAAEPAPTARERRWLGHYELLEEIARGGCGMVHRAWQHGLERVVAVKVLLPEYSRLLRARQRFCQEARVMASLRHPHILPIHEIGEHQGVIYFSMDYVAAGSLAARLPSAVRRPGEQASEMMPLREAVQVIETVARAVDHAHGRGVVHCDLKPSNILLDECRGPQVTDFGLAKLPIREADDESPEEIVGTPAYMAPEQVRGSPELVTPATDVWALGVILYETLAGRRPFEGSAVGVLQQLWAYDGRLTFPRAGRTEPLQAVCRCCLSVDPARRYATAAALADALADAGT